MTCAARRIEDFLGKGLDAIDTPALVVDVEALDANLRKMAEYFADRPCKMRPHFKSHKCVALAKRQLAAGSIVGITCAKLCEAEHLVAGGVTDVLIANQIIGVRKAARLAALNRDATVRVAVDGPEQVAQLGTAACEAGVTIGVLVEVDIGMGRCGVPAGQPTVDLAQRVIATDGVRFDGLQGYEGHLITKPDPEERRALVTEAFAPLVETRRALEAAGLPVAIVSSGGTGTYDITGNIEGIDELQCGTYALMDAYYRTVRPEFNVARWVLSSVISTASGGVVTDVGVKGLGCEFGPPEVDAVEGATVRYNAEEHTVIDGMEAAVGDRVMLTPSHGCTTNALYREMWITRNGVIEDIWPIEAAGCLE